MRKDKVDVYLAIGWLIVVFDPNLFGVWKEETKDGYFITKLKVHRYKLDNNSSNEKIIELKDVIDKFIEKNEEFRKKTFFSQYFFRPKMKESAKRIFECANEFLEEK